MMPQIIRDENLEKLWEYVGDVINGKEDVSNIFPMEAIGEMADEILKANDAYKAIKFFVSIPTRLYMWKYQQFCSGLHKIDKEEYAKYLQHIGREKVNKEIYIILGIIEKIEEDEKIEYIDNIFKARVENMIDENTYRRLLIYVSRTPHADLLYMRRHISTDAVPLDSIELEGLLSNGWLNIVPIGKQSIGNESISCCYNQIAFKFYEIVNDIKKD